MTEIFTRCCFLIPRAEISYLRFILESYDGLAFMRTLDPASGLVEVAFSPSRALDVEPLLSALAEEFPMTEAPIPAPGIFPPM
jgi:hypothetical protein